MSADFGKYLETFRVNGCLLGAEEPHPFIDQAHAIAECIDIAMRSKDEGGLNDELATAAVRGIATLLWIAQFGQAQLDERRSRQNR